MNAGEGESAALRRVVLRVALLNLAYFGVKGADLLARFRRHAGSLTKAAFLSARNDALANVAIIGAGWVTALTASGWPDLLVGLGIAAMNANAARGVWEAACEEGRMDDLSRPAQP